MLIVNETFKFLLVRLYFLISRAKIPPRTFPLAGCMRDHKMLIDVIAISENSCLKESSVGKYRKYDF